MSYKLFIILFVFCGFAAISCSLKKVKEEKTTDKKNEQEVIEKKSEKKAVNTAGGLLSNYDISSQDPQVLKLSSVLMEISGITFTPDNRLFTHGDEYGDIYELNPDDGKIIKMFSLGDIKVIKGDFEDIAYANEKFYLLESKGKLYEFSEGINGSFADYKTYKTSLNSKNNTEGLCYDPETNSLLLACKDFGGDDYAKDKTVYSFSLEKMTMQEIPRFIISNKKIKNNTEEGKFHPSGIARNPVSGTFFIIAARGNTILELSKEGDILGQDDLPESVHKQAEGIAFKSDGTLYISDEGRGNTPLIVIYPLKK
ncbi:MAG: SdiA-regulated domain-containing protein [Ignavibacteria bacterium]